MRLPAAPACSQRGCQLCEQSNSSSQYRPAGGAPEPSEGSTGNHVCCQSERLQRPAFKWTEGRTATEEFSKLRRQGCDETRGPPGDNLPPPGLLPSTGNGREGSAGALVVVEFLRPFLAYCQSECTHLPHSCRLQEGMHSVLLGRRCTAARRCKRWLPCRSFCENSE